MRTLINKNKFHVEKNGVRKIKPKKVMDSGYILIIFETKKYHGSFSCLRHQGRLRKRF